MKILVISLAGIGDTLLITPFLRELRLNFPDATIDVMVKEAGARDFLENNPDINRVFFKDLLKCGKIEGRRFFRSLRAERYDISINTHPQTRIHYRVAAWMVGAKIRVSHEYECSGFLDRFLVNRTIPQDYQLHTIENNEALLPLIGARAKAGPLDMRIYLKPEEEQWAQNFLTGHGLTKRKRLGVHVGSGGTKNLRLKRWPLENYIKLIGRLNQVRPDLSIILFGGREEVEDHANILAATDRRLVLESGSKSLRQSAALIQRCDGFLSVDTALMHVAAAMKVPHQIVIEAFTLNQSNLPHGNPYTLVPNPAIQGRHLDFYRFDGKDIKGTREELIGVMSAVTVDAVFRAVSAELP